MKEGLGAVRSTLYLHDPPLEGKGETRKLQLRFRTDPAGFPDPFFLFVFVFVFVIVFVSWPLIFSSFLLLVWRLL